MIKRQALYGISYFLGVALLFVGVTQSKAASVGIDDSNPDTYGVSSSDFDLSFSSSPSGNGIPDGTTLDFMGSYISYSTFNENVDYLIAAASDPGNILAELDLSASDSGS